jgi:hypothetical protein
VHSDALTAPHTAKSTLTFNCCTTYGANDDADVDNYSPLETGQMLPHRKHRHIRQCAEKVPGFIGAKQKELVLIEDVRT